MVEVAVHGAVLEWARRYRRLSPEDAAARIRVPVEDLLVLERGERLPTITLFKRLRDAYRLPEATLVRSRPPRVPPPPKDFRTLDGRPPVLGLDTQVAIEQARGLLTQMAELDLGLGDVDQPTLRRYNLRANPHRQGETERRLLGLPILEQLEWDAEEAFRRWREAIEACGVYVCLDRFNLDDCRGFSLHDPGMPPGIVINKKEEFVPARTFTLIHEYAHLLISEPGISDENPRNPVEAFCNRFAAAVLMPGDALSAVIGGLPNEPVEWEHTQVQKWARRLGVSGQALSLRLEQAACAPPGFYDQYRAAAEAAAASITRRRAGAGVCIR
jgi:Zn-dependent peptidase ImmA (M78 family)